MRGNPFACLGSGSAPSENYPPHINMAPKQSKSNQSSKKSSSSSSSSSIPFTARKSTFSKVVPPIPSINLAAKSLMTCEPFIESYMNRDYQFIFRSRPIDSCRYEPYKILLLIASAQGYHHRHHDDVFDPRLSADGVSQSKIVSAALRRAKQPTPQLIYCSTMYRALSTMQLVCPDWYDDIDKIVALDELRPRCGTFKYNKRSNIVQLNHAFKRVSFDYIKHNEDHLWNESELESDDLWNQRIHEFVTKYLIPQNEMIHSMYGTVKCAKMNNIGWNSSKPTTPTGSASQSLSKYTALFQRRVVVVSHCDFFEHLMRNVITDVSSELRKKWKHCDTRKVFVYTKQQLGIANIPYYISPLSSNEFRTNHRKNKRNKNQSQLPMRKSGSYPRPKGVILMRNKSFESHRFTLTTMSAALINTRHKVPSSRRIQFSRSVDTALAKKKRLAHRQLHREAMSADQVRVSKYDEPFATMKAGDENEEESSEYLVEGDTTDEGEEEDIKVWNARNNNNNNNHPNNGNKYDHFLSHQPRKHIIVITPPPT